MSVSSVWMLHGILFPGAQFISEITDATLASNIEDLTGYASGYPDPLFLSNRAVTPDIKFSTPQLKTILDLCSTTFIADLSGGNTDLFYKAALDLGVRQADAGTVHERRRMATGAVYWDRVGATHQQDASISCRIVPIYNGTNAPIVSAGSLALAGTAAASTFWTLGPVSINGSILPGVKSWSLDLGLQVIVESASGDVYPTFCAIGQRAPVLEVTSLEAGAWTSYGLDGTACTAAIAYLRKKAPDVSNVADATASHISFTAAKGKINVITTSGGGNTPAQTTLRIPLRAPDSSTAVVVINTATAIT